MSASQATTTVYFFCQRCRLPLKLDKALLDLTVKEWDSLLAPLKAGGKDLVEWEGFPPAEAAPDDGVSRRTLAAKLPEKVEPPINKPAAISEPSPGKPEAPSEEQQAPEGGKERMKLSLNHRYKVATRLFDILSSSTPIDHPLCVECYESFERDLSESIREAETERIYCQDFLLKKEFLELSESDREHLEEEILSLQEEDLGLLQELKQIELEREVLTASLEQLRNEEASLVRAEQILWNEQNDFQADLEDFFEERDSLASKHNHANDQLNKLRKTNVYNDVFRIWHDGPFGTINGLRLGRLSNHPVEWNEINAAWGQALLLLDTLATRIEFKFAGYRLIPSGSLSRIERFADGKILDLFTTGDLGRFFKTGRFDAMVAFLDCLQQLGSHILAQDKNFTLPYKIEGDKIGGCSVKTQFNDAEWTKALKYTLTNLKWLLTWVAQQT